MGFSNVHSLADIRVRDPFLLTVSSERAYYLFGSAHAEFADSLASGFDCYRSTDLESWQGPIPAFRSPPGFWADRNFWAPEVHAHAGRYFMFATFDAEGVARGTQVLVADRPTGPYMPWSDGPLTPVDWDCSGGTLHMDETRAPWIVFCRDRTQFVDSEFVAQRLTADLRRPVGERILLFRASDAELGDAHRCRAVPAPPPVRRTRHAVVQSHHQRIRHGLESVRNRPHHRPMDP